jgi:hypothetical protein
MKGSWSYGLLAFDANAAVISARRAGMCSGWRLRATMAHVSALIVVSGQVLICELNHLTICIWCVEAKSNAIICCAMRVGCACSGVCEHEMTHSVQSI